MFTRYRKSTWLNVVTMKSMFGIEGRVEQLRTKWIPCAEDGKPLLFASESERDAKLKALRREARLSLPS